MDKLHLSIERYRDVELTEDSRMTLGEWLDIQKPSVKRPKSVRIISDDIKTSSKEIKIIMTADVIYTGKVWQDEFINLGIDLTHDDKQKIKAFDNISKNFIGKEHHTNEVCKLEFTKVFNIKDFKNIDFEIYLRPTDKDYLWNPEHSVTLKNINIKMLESINY